VAERGAKPGDVPDYVEIGHYLQTLESDFHKAVNGGAKSGAFPGAVRNA
jgi:hypothetical protein